MKQKIDWLGNPNGTTTYSQKQGISHFESECALVPDNVMRQSSIKIKTKNKNYFSPKHSGFFT